MKQFVRARETWNLFRGGIRRLNEDNKAVKEDWKPVTEKSISCVVSFHDLFPLNLCTK
jgi:hypothetical protein